MRIIKALGYGVLTLFCCFGGLASFEPTSSGSIHTGWLTAYVVAGLTFATLFVRVFGNARRPGPGHTSE